MLRRRAPRAVVVAGLLGLAGCAHPVPAAAPPLPPLPPPSSSPATAGNPPINAPRTALLAAASGGALRGKIIVIDPGHNGANGRHPRQISRKVDILTGRKACDTTGTQTNAGYPESAFNYDVARQVQSLLRAAGATVVLTRPDDKGVGPCITERAAIGNRARAHAVLSIHADGAPPSAHGFHVIVPRGIGRNDAIVSPSRRLGIAVRDAFGKGTGQPLATYTGTRTAGLVARNDLGGLNLSTVPKVFIECGNMRNAADARRMSSPAWRRRAAQALADGLTAFVAAPSTPGRDQAGEARMRSARQADAAGQALTVRRPADGQ